MDEYSLIDVLYSIDYYGKINSGYLSNSLSMDDLRETANFFKLYVPLLKQNDFINEMNFNVDFYQKLKSDSILSDSRYNTLFDTKHYYNCDRDKIIKPFIIQTILKYMSLDYFKDQLPEIYKKFYNHRSFDEYIGMVEENCCYPIFQRFFNRRRLLILLGMIGFYSRRYGFFLTRDDYKEFNNDYVNKLNKINKTKVWSLDMFGSWGRLGKFEQYNDVIDLSYSSILELLLDHISGQRDVLFSLFVVVCKPIKDKDTIKEMFDEADQIIKSEIEKGTMENLN